MLVNLMLVDTATMNAYNGGWVDFCRTRRLVEGMPVKFIATKPLDNQVIYVKVAADFSMQTTLVQQMIDGKFVPSVVAAQFFAVTP
ncbi:unnamed protein product [Trifolium pratense]|uniref:Uncharacterized protein n=1 Tax=Trifolium pratense TaxID=57577 RepID=A0ACB0JGQ3_TRIPR|nr:unnamed protein product [Trifolium pratense]